jgi:hypothetical protein
MVPQTITSAADALHNRRTVHILGGNLDAVVDSGGAIEEPLVGQVNVVCVEEGMRGMAQRSTAIGGPHVCVHLPDGTNFVGTRGELQ